MAVSVGRTVDGLFGIDILAEHVLEFDFQRERLVLHDTTSFTPPDGAAGLPITLMGAGGKPTIPVTIHLASGDAIDGQFCMLQSNDGGRTWIDRSGCMLPAPKTGEAAFAASGTCLVARDAGQRFSLVTGGGPSRSITFGPAVADESTFVIA